ncbi:hypothetical protein HOB76_08865, partial [Candidatus Woesearchaeota archaeon]|nr:hypothetical protein [Candidatus Woesearchaeota archaeon]
MSEEKLAKESEELTEEEIAEKAKATAKEDSSDGNEDDDEEEVEEGKSAKASVKKEEEDEEESDSEEDEEEVEEAVKAVVPKTKNGMLKSVYEKLNGLKKDQLAAQYETILKATDIVKEDSVEEEVESKRTKAAITAEDLNIDVKDDVEALIQGEDGLTEEFKQKASTIFEAAVQSKVLEEVNKKANEIEAQLKEDQDKSGADFKKDMSEKVDGYLTYVVEEWMKENELAIEKGIRSELVEDFMSGLRTLFSEHYIDIPEEKVDMVDDLFTKVEDLETSLDEEMNRGVELQKELAQFKKDDALKEATKELADTETEKISKLAEGIEYENTEQYIEKLNVLKESYFPKSDT